MRGKKPAVTNLRTAGRSKSLLPPSARGIRIAVVPGLPLHLMRALPMSSDGSVTNWVDQLKAGDHAAAQPLWERYFRRLVELARRKLQGAPRRAADEEDVALSAFDSFCRGAEEGRFPQLSDRDNLWKLLVALAAHKAIDLARAERRQKRGGGAVLDDLAVLDLRRSDSAEPGLEQVIGPEPTPDLPAQLPPY